jgi:hypothetical protein
MVIGLAQVAQVEQLLLKKNNKNLKEPSMKWMKQHAEKTFSKLAFYLCHPCQASVHAAFNVYLGVFQPVPIGVSCAKNQIDLTLKQSTSIPYLTRLKI